MVSLTSVDNLFNQGSNMYSGAARMISIVFCFCVYFILYRYRDVWHDLVFFQGESVDFNALMPFYKGKQLLSFSFGCPYDIVIPQSVVLYIERNRS